MQLVTDKHECPIILDIDLRKGVLHISARDKCESQSVYFGIQITSDNKEAIIRQLERLRSDIQDYEPNRYEAWIYKGDDNDD